MLDLEWASEDMQEMQNLFNTIGMDALFMSHYDLAKNSKYNAADWKAFITEPHVADYITQELRILKQTELRKILKNISGKSSSVGTGQTLNALLKSLEGETFKDGPTFIYTYIPLTPNEMAAPNVRRLERDPFIRED